MNAPAQIEGQAQQTPSASLKPFEQMDFHPANERLAEFFCNKANNDNIGLFRMQVAYYFSVVASMMRAKIVTRDSKPLPVNMYAINLAPSGSGKTMCSSIMEEEVINQFRYQFTEQTLPLLAAQNLPKIANTRAVRKGTDPDEELENVEKEFENSGPLLFSFDDATESAIKQARHKLLMAKAGSLNLMIDEIGVNISGAMEALHTFLELYDKGHIKQKLVKHTKENSRNEEIIGNTPANLLMFGAPTRLLNGSKTEEEFSALLDTGYARRCFFSYAKNHNRMTRMSAQEILDQRKRASNNSDIDKYSDQIGRLADMAFANKKLVVPEHVELLFILYQKACEERAEEMPEHAEIKKAEMSHRHFKALKMAGVYAFIDGSPEITEDHAYYAMKLAESSGEDFEKMLTRDKPYVKLAKYIASVGRNVTQADLVEELPFYPKAANQQRDQLTLAIAYGYKNNILIKKSFSDGVEFLRGETLKNTDLTKMRVSYSQDIAQGYQNETAPWDQLHRLIQAQGYHWVNHHLKGGHRQEDNALPGFNLVVLDVDGGTNLSTAKMLLKDYKALIYTTKRHTDQDHRFRIILPTNFELELDQQDYKEFYRNVIEWLPFEVDEVCGQRAKKWLSHNGHYEYQDGELLDVLPFIPKTSKNEDFKHNLSEQQNFDNLERWVLNNTGDGNRNNQLLRYAMILVDAGFDFEGIRRKVLELNDKLQGKLEEAEVMGTIMVTVGKAIAKR